MEATVQSNIDAWNSAFADYVKFTSKQPQEALEHKVNALGIALYRGFAAHQFGGLPRQRGIAVGELNARTAAGRGTTIRSTLLAEYQAAKTFLRGKARGLKQAARNFGGTLDQWSGIQSALSSNRAQRISAWQEIVGREVHARQSGIGELAAAFLWYRNRGKGDARRLVPNRRGQTLGSVDVNEGGALIMAQVAGINTVDARYGIVTKAISDETDDTMKYVKEKQDEAAESLLKNVLG